MDLRKMTDSQKDARIEYLSEQWQIAVDERNALARKLGRRGDVPVPKKTIIHVHEQAKSKAKPATVVGSLVVGGGAIREWLEKKVHEDTLDILERMPDYVYVGVGLVLGIYLVAMALEGLEKRG